MTEGTELLAQLGDQRILLSVVISAALVAFVWRVDMLLVRYTQVSDEIVDNLRGFRGVATGTMVVVTLAWIVGQPTPGWIAGPFEAVAGPQFVDGLVAFLPPFVVNNPGPLSVTLLGLWWTWKLRVKGDEIIERSVAVRYDETLAPIAGNVWDVTIIAVFFLLVLEQWGIGIATLLAPAGIIGIILGFAARKTVANFFGSLSLYADETYKRGDFIELENGTTGTVRDISVRSTVLQTLDGDLVTVPNAELSDGEIINKSSPRPNRRIQSTVGVSYDADPGRVKRVLEEAATPLSRRRESVVHLRSFGDSALVFEVFVWIEKPADRRQAEHELNMAIHRALDTANIEIPYPQRDIAVNREPPAEI
ncbi:MAG: small-conductance mechanosensitive channel [halophilic archaeon J07HX64]|nr:MAG: small-conductance mechanosensitive channel [halophilic archaeon J07HX64]